MRNIRPVLGLVGYKGSGIYSEGMISMVAPPVAFLVVLKGNRSRKTGFRCVLLSLEIAQNAAISPWIRSLYISDASLPSLSPVAVVIIFA
jgi:hypothetical protein